ncbi:metallophosphoesterase (plasmid) [Pantoea agglomerans]|uniref:metallophosphoesterase n=1 Tax=Enterobacter agglomerans TaxID=549 RepID=UPI00177F8111|nr:metallophosphoesterase [Pantoea agglomerans]WLO87360.1 metallophosphoesterase [Pantoea agglomerans]WVJ49084.1 metallophosphoesterase [Pantoea agglomerans]
MLILHLSDIHFRKSEIGTAQDPNIHLRNELIRDVEEQCKQLGPPDVIIVSGDVAFAGDPEEFEFASQWLSELCQRSGGSMKSVFVVPGNHDVVRSQADSLMVQLLHKAIKNAGDRASQEIARHLSDKEAQRLLYHSLENYNQFAFQFFCDLMPPNRTRARRDVTLNDGSTLRLWGLNSAFVSSSQDKPGDIFVDPASFQITREKGVVNLVITHHHLSWLRQAQEFEDHFNSVAPVQIFGHVHLNRIVRNRDYLRLTASAANPDRSEPGWEPGYNLIELSVTGGPEARVLHTRSHVRIWQASTAEFNAKMDRRSFSFDHDISLESWYPPVEQVRTYDDVLVVEPEVTTMESGRGEVMDSLRDLGLRFYRLSFSKKLEIAGRLELLEEEDMRLPDFERFRRVFIRASDRGIVREFNHAITAAEQG